MSLTSAMSIVGDCSGVKSFVNFLLEYMITDNESSSVDDISEVGLT